MIFLFIYFYSIITAFSIDQSYQTFCFDPISAIAGGTSGSTVFKVMDQDIYDNTAIGGYSSDYSLVSYQNMPNPLVVYVLSSGSIKWIMSLDSSYNEITAIGISSDNLKIIAALDTQQGQNLALTVLQVSDGSHLGTYQFAASGHIYPQGIFSSFTLSLAAQYNGKWAYIKLSSSMATSSSFKILGDTGSSARGIYDFFDKDINLRYYVYGIVVTSTQTYSSIHLFDQSSNQLGSFSYAQGLQPSSYYTIDRLEQYQLLTGDKPRYLMTCGDKTDGSSVITLTDAQSCIQIDPMDENNVYFLLYKPGKILLGYLDYFEQNAKIYYYKVAILSADSGNVLYHGKSQYGGDFYFVGSVKTINTSPVKDYTASNDISIGLFMLSGTTSSGIASTSTLLSALFIAQTALSLISVSNSATTAMNMITQVDTVPVYVIASTLPDRVYTIAQSSQQYSFLSYFTVNGASCSDAQYTYEIIGTLPSFATFSTFKITVQSNDESKVGDYYIYVKVTINNGQTFTGSFKLTVKSQCTTVTITKKAISTQTYYVSQPYLSFQYTAFDITPSTSSCTITYTLTLSDGSAIDSSFIRTFEPSNRTIIVYTQDESKAQISSYSLKLTGYLTNYPTTTQSQSFSLDIKSCYQDSINISPSITDKSHLAKPTVTTTTTLVTITSTQSLSGICPQVTYTLVGVGSLNNEIVADQIFTLSSNILTVTTVDTSKIGVYKLKVYAITKWETTTYTSVYNTFTVTISSYCDSAVITTNTPAEQDYYISSNSKTFTFIAWTSTLSASDSSTNDMALLSPSSAYSIALTGTLSQTKFSIVNFNIVFKSPCETATISVGASVISDQTYKLNSIQDPNPYYFDDFISSISSSYILTYCGTLTYTFKDASGNDLDSLIFTTSSSSRSITVFTDSEINLSNSPYLVVVKGYYSNYIQQFATFKFKVNLQKDCYYQRATAPATQLVTYMLSESEKEIDPGSFTLLFSTGCPLFYTYICELQLDNSACPSMNSFIKSFESSTGKFKIQSDNAATGNYLIKISGQVASTQDSGTYTSPILIITLTIVPASCILEVPTTTIGSFKIYSIGSTLDIPYQEFNVATGSCDTQYTLYQDSCTGTQIEAGSGAILEPVVTLDPTNKKITATQTFTLRISACSIIALDPSSQDTQTNTLATQTYFINQGTKDITFNAFTETTTTGSSCGFQIAYSIQVLGYLTPPSFLTLITTTDPLNLQVLSTSKQDCKKNPYLIIITASVNNPGIESAITSILTIPLLITQLNLAAPKFIPELQDISMKVGETTQLVFSDPIDTDGDVVSVSDPKFGQAAFISGSYPNFQLKPKFSDLGEYKVQVTVTDDNMNPLSGTYTFQITVTKTASETVDSTSDQENNINIGSIPVKKNIIKDKKSIKLKAEIRSISIKGLVNVQFSTNVIIPADYKNFDSKVMLIQIKDDEGKIDKRINYTWNYLNKLQITFLYNGFFLEKQSGLPISYSYQIQRNVPKQLRTDSATAALASNGGSGVSTLSSFMYGSLAFNIVILLMDMANFDILPSQDIQSNVFEFEDSTTPEVKRIYDFFAKRLLFNTPIRMFLEGFMSFFINSCLNLYVLKWDSNSERFASVLAIMLVCTSFTFPFMIMGLLIPKYKNLQEMKVQNSYGALYADIRTNAKSPLFFNVIYMGRRIIFAGVAIIGQDYPFFQIQALIFHCIFVIIYLVSTKPFQKPLNNFLEIINEICIIGAAYHLLILTDYNPDDDLQYMAGWSLIIITVFNMLINISVMITLSAVDLVQIVNKDNDKFQEELLSNFEKTNLNATAYQEGNSIFILQTANDFLPRQVENSTKRKKRKIPNPKMARRDSINFMENTNDNLIGKLISPHEYKENEKEDYDPLAQYQNAEREEYKLDDFQETEGAPKEDQELDAEIFQIYQKKQECLKQKYKQLSLELEQIQKYDTPQNRRKRNNQQIITVKINEPEGSPTRQIQDDLIMNINLNSVNYETSETNFSISKQSRNHSLNTHGKKAKSNNTVNVLNSKKSRFNNKNRTPKINTNQDKLDEIIVESLDLEQNSDIMTLAALNLQRNTFQTNKNANQNLDYQVTSSLEVHNGHLEQIRQENPWDTTKQSDTQKIFKSVKKRLRMKATL
ncbi:cadg domain containing protein [Stylonychia lemnae]|uniref:Cadg domain containing protein n=1 Tax=Stylonychia lemnae TaxID=5949 RepID=A0A077ZQJ5_STYLE|nr:cadg domain containing protein [Stylonychia lemnae]|eukprot:CDW71724.1 cadg domain containing protein [Stylonychia lemnae]